MKYPDGVSLIICTYNGAKRLPDTIGYVNRQIVDADIPWELLIIDNASTDGSSDIAMQTCSSEVPHKVILEPEKGLIHARHRGIQEATFEYISFIDDDNWIDPNWIRNIYTIFKTHPKAGMCGGISTGAFSTQPPEWFKAFQGSYAIGRQGDKTGDITEKPGQLWGAGLSFRKSAFETLVESGFNSILTGRKGDKLLAGEDTELTFAFRLAGWRLWYSEDLTLQHFIPPERFKWEYVRKMYKGFGYSHAIFEIYKFILFNRRLCLLSYILKIYFGFLPFFIWKMLHLKKSYEGNKMELLYHFHLSKLLKALELLPQVIRMYKQIESFRDNYLKAAH